MQLEILPLRQNSDYQSRIAFNLGKMPSHNGIHDHARVRIVNALGAEKFPLLVEAADEFLEMSGQSFDLEGNQCRVQSGNSSPTQPGSPGPAGHLQENRCRFNRTAALWENS